ncbi:poly(A) RNA polymerase GLD2 isoform X3 [Pygocentrus nattereri]|uniref:poly(A) RNA polymerase GLD2 isoform X3 n=1 Tax=Pygocentrus nattereri TaxID=42514 RepID=UPI0018915D5D|nr:poly(A) RNA polymerase GLD2 isoform X3 [Pygocentrus nattereri]
MLPRSPAFPHKHGQTRPDTLFTQRLLPHAFSQQQRIESHLNLTNTNFHNKPLNVFPILPTYQWNPAPNISFTSPTGSRNRKRKNDGNSQDDLKRQRCSPHPYKQMGKTFRFSPVRRVEQGSTRVSVGEGCSPVRSPLHSPGTSNSVGCVPSLREDSCHNANSSLPPSLIKDKLSQQILELFLACEQQSEDLERKESCRAQLQRDIQRLFPCARVFLAGSSLNGFGSRSSDADLCLVVQDGPVNQRTDAVCILSLVQKLLYKLFEKRVRPIILVIKKWASYHRINDASRGTLSSYTLVLMVLHYLQTLPEPVIPCLQKDYPECFSPVMDIHLVPDGPKNIPSFVSKNQSSLGDLLLGFLKYFATVFRWDKCVISVREAKALPKPNCREWKDKFICVEEPFDGSNTARAVHEKMKFDDIKAQFTESWQVLQVRKDLNYILPIREARPKR